MPAIRPTRPHISDRFSVLGLTVQTGQSPYFEVAMASDPALFSSDRQPARNASNFYSTRGIGALPAERGEAVFLLRPDILRRFVGQKKLYFKLAMFADTSRRDAEIFPRASDALPSVTISDSFTGREARRVLGVPNHRGGLEGNANAYVSGNAEALRWAGDEQLHFELKEVKRAAGADNAAANAPAAQSLGDSFMPYDDGYDQRLWSQPQATTEADADAAEDAADNAVGGIDEPLRDEGSYSEQQSYSQPFAVSEYPQASRFAPAHPSNYSHRTRPRSVNLIVIHITDGHRNINGPISMFQTRRPGHESSAHYIVGQDGEVVQMVANNDVAYHAHGVSAHSIGIEHVANSGLDKDPRTHKPIMARFDPTEAEYCASAALVSWLCEQYQIPIDRDHIKGHSEADPQTTHSDCPNAVWDWDYFMGLVRSRECYPSSTSNNASQAEPANGNGSRAAAQSQPSAQSLAYAVAAGYGGQPSSGSRRGGATTARGHGAAIATPLSVVEPLYTPTNTQDALRFMTEWLARKERWRTGVADTGFFPHSAICQMSMTFPNGEYLGTGFYIASNIILTCAHNVIDWASRNEAGSIVITPGRNGQNNRPFPSFTVSRSDWDYHPNYDGTRDFDLAVIRVGTPPPQGAFFPQLEELLESRDSPIIVCGYAAIPGSQYNQHLDGDMIRAVSDNTFQYNLQTEPGNSGSPIYYLWGYEDEQRQMSVSDMRVVGVHVSSYDANLNQGCRLTAAKIRWIQETGNLMSMAQSYSVSGSVGARERVAAKGSRPFSGEECFNLNWPDVPLIPQPTNDSCWAAAAAMVASWDGLASYPPNPNPKPADITEVARRFGLDVEQPQSYSINGFRQLLETSGPLWVAAAVPGFHAIVVTGMYSDGSPDGADTYVRINDPWDRSPGTPGAPGPYLATHERGSQYILTWRQFTDEYEAVPRDPLYSGVTIQILHAAGTGGRRPVIPAQSLSSGALSLFAFLDSDVQNMRAEFVRNAAAGAAKRNCITITDAGLRQLFNQSLLNTDGTAKALGSTIQDTMAALQGYGLAQSAQVFEFNDSNGRLTKGVAAPVSLRASVAASLLSQAEALARSGWYCFGLSLMDGYHSALLALSFSGTSDPSTKFYWADQIYNGWDDVTSTLDDRITRLTLRWWTPLPANRKAKTRVTIWPLNP